MSCPRTIHEHGRHSFKNRTTRPGFQRSDRVGVCIHMSRLMGKPTICICKNKDADQLRGNREADQRLCFRYTISTIPLLLKSEISSFQPASVLVQAGLCRTCSETTLLVFPRGGSMYTLPYKPEPNIVTEISTGN